MCVSIHPAAILQIRRVGRLRQTQPGRQRAQSRIFSVFLLLFTANGIFEPLEVALNRAWGIAKNRSFVKNQIISLALIFACGTSSIGKRSLNVYKGRYGESSLRYVRQPGEAGAVTLMVKSAAQRSAPGCCYSG